MHVCESVFVAVDRKKSSFFISSFCRPLSGMKEQKTCSDFPAQSRHISKGGEVVQRLHKKPDEVLFIRLGGRKGVSSALLQKFFFSKGA